MAEEGAATDDQDQYGTKPVAPSLAWTDIKLQEVKKFMKIDKPEDALQFVASKFALTDYETNARSAILVDFYLSILVFCKEKGFSEEKASAAFTIVRVTRDSAVSGGKSVQQAFEEFKGLVLKHALSGVPHAVVLFQPQDVVELTKYVTGTFMQHYRLYQYAHNHEQDKDQHVTHLFVDTAADPPPLRLAKQELDDPPPEAPKEEEVSAQEEAPAEEQPPEESEEEIMKKKVAELLAEKTKQMEEAMQAKMAIQMNTLKKQLEGLGV